MPALFELYFSGFSILASIVADALMVCATAGEHHRRICEAAIEAADPVPYWRGAR